MNALKTFRPVDAQARSHDTQFAAPPKEPKIDTSKKHKIFVENYTNAPEPITVEVPTENGKWLEILTLL